VHIYYIYSNIGRDITKFIVIFGVYIQLWPT